MENKTDSKFFSPEKPYYISPKDNKYSLDELVKFIKDEGSFVDYKLIDGGINGKDFHEPLPKEDIKSLLENEKIREAYEAYVEQNSQLVQAVNRVNDNALQLLKNLTSSGRELVRKGWHMQEHLDDKITDVIAVPVKELHLYLEDHPRQAAQLDTVGDYLKLKYSFARGTDLSRDVGEVYGGTQCSSGFISAISKVTALVESVDSYLEFGREHAPQNK